MKLVDTEIKRALDSGAWKAYRDGEQIGFDDLVCGPNSVDCSLGSELLEVDAGVGGLFDVVDPRNPESVSYRRHVITDEGFTIWPDQLYLASVRESFDCGVPLWIDKVCVPAQEFFFAPMIDGRSTLARVGLSVHNTAGFGDFGFDGQFTLELTCTLPIVLYPGMRIAQVSFDALCGTPTNRYEGAYQHQTGPRPAVLGEGRV